MKKSLTKIFAGVMLCLSLFAMPIMLVGCKKEDTQTKNSVLESMNEVVLIGDLTYSLIDFTYDTQTKNLEAVLVIENYSDSNIEIAADSFMTNFGVKASALNPIMIQKIFS